LIAKAIAVAPNGLTNLFLGAAMFLTALLHPHLKLDSLMSKNYRPPTHVEEGLALPEKAWLS